MACMVPDTPPEPGPGRKAETALYEALAAGLPDDFFVYHGLSCLERQGAAEAELDFLVLHREHGLLAIECKGRGVRRTGTGKWFRLLEDGREWPLKEDPFQQAQRALKSLARELDDRLRKTLPSFQGRFPFVHGHALAFPLALVKDVNLPLSVQKEIVLDAADLQGIHEWVLRAFAFWSAASPPREPLSAREFRSFRRGVLHQAFRVTESLGAQLLLDADRFVRLTEEQVLALKGILAQPRLLVSGGAGTGKTVLALDAARMLAAGGRRTLMLCYNQPLARLLEQAVRAGEGETPNIEVATFHALCRKAQEALGRPFQPPASGDREGAGKFWNETAPFMLLEALNEGRVAPWDGIVVDEGQDFAADWWGVIEECLRDKAGGAFHVFYDPRQEIFGRGCRVPKVGPEIPLRLNVRNTGAVFAAMRELAPLDMDLHPRAPRGQEVRRHLQRSPNHAREEIEQLLRCYLEDGQVRPEQVAILTPHTRENSLFAGLESLAGRPLADNPALRQGAILHTTVGRFKGLESDIVFFADVDPQDPRCGTGARYVAVSRARQVLHEFWKRPW